MRLSEVLSSKPDRLVTLPPTAPVADAAALMRREGIGAVLVCDKLRRVLGVLSERELALSIDAWGEELFELCVGEMMTVGAPTASPADAVQNVMRIMTEQRVRHMPVIEDGVVVGIVSIGDVLKSRLAEKVQENAVLQDLARARLPG
jgi:CBS domain-containing protein